jgi:stalled ribosome rescue protein Dom34
MKISMNSFNMNYGIQKKIVNIEGFRYTYLTFKTRVETTFPVEKIKKHNGLMIYASKSKPTKNNPAGDKIYLWIKFAAPETQENKNYLMYLGRVLEGYHYAKMIKKYQAMTTQEGVEHADIVKHAPSDASQSHKLKDILSPFIKDEELPF